jgi:hypothetical protein
VVWFIDFGGVSVGVRERTNYLGSYDRNLLLGSAGTRGDATHPFGGYFRVVNPMPGQPTPHVRSSFAAWYVEGRAGLAFDVDRSLRAHMGSRSDPHAGFGGEWMATTDMGYLDRRLWDDAGTVEVGPWFATTVQHGTTVFGARAVARGGLVYRNPGVETTSPHTYDVGAFARLTGEGSVRTPFWMGTRLGIRLFGGAYASGSDPVKQRRIMVAGADPYETFTNPLLRSAGALFVRPDFHYQAPATRAPFAPISVGAGRWRSMPSSSDRCSGASAASYAQWRSRRSLTSPSSTRSRRVRRPPGDGTPTCTTPESAS